MWVHSSGLLTSNSVVIAILVESEVQTGCQDISSEAFPYEANGYWHRISQSDGQIQGS